MALEIKRFFRRRYWPAWVTLVVGLTASAGLGWKLHREAVLLDRQRLALRIKETAGQLEGRLEKTELLLRQLQDYLMLSGETRNQVLNEWCRKHGLAFNQPWVLGIAVLTNRHADPWRADFPSSPRTWTRADWAALQGLALNRPIQCDIAMKSGVRPPKRFLADYDLKGLMQETNRFTSAIKKNEVRMTGRRSVMLDAQDQALTGCFFMVPVYRREVDDLLPLARWDDEAKRGSIRWLHLTSMILAPIDFKVLEQAVWGEVAPDLGVELFSSTKQTAETWLNISAGGPRAADPQFKAYLTDRLIWPMYSDRFSIFFYTTPLFDAQSPRRLVRIATTAGTGTTLLASALLAVALRARNRQARMTEQIREARDALAAAQQERQKLSHDLHDNTIQALYAIQLGLGHTSQKLEAEPASARRELSAVRAELDAVIAEVRRFITAEENGNKVVDLSGVLHALAQRVRTGTTAQIEAHCDSEASDRLSGTQAVQLANIAREALSNSVRHGKPRRVEIALRSEPESVRLEISDDGSGFDPKSSAQQGVGLTSMATRAKEMRGTLDIQSAPGSGTRVTIRVPASPAECDGAESNAAESVET